MASCLKGIVLLLAFGPLPALAQPQLDIPTLQPPLRQIAPDAYRTRVESLRSLVRACRGDAKACDPAATGDDDKIVSSTETFQVRWQWLRKVLDDSRNPALPDRAARLDEAMVRLDEELNPTSVEAQSNAEFNSAKLAAASILARSEFRVVGNESWLDRWTARFWVWVFRLFTAASTLGHRAPWLSRVLEWSFVGLAAAIALFWVLRTMQRDRMAISLSSAIPAANWQKESDDWAELARVEAEQGNWRDAIHCLYWASIVVLESRRLWRRDAARTPREYVELLERNSPQQHTLRSITRIFERIWYGIRAAAQEDYLQAQAHFEELRRT